MMEAMGAAISGLEAQQTMLNTTANNLANVDTIGYKSQETSFVDALSQTIAGGSGPTSENGGSDPEQVGLGVQVGAIENNMSQGSDQSTGNGLDLAIQGNGFFQVAPSTSTSGGTVAGDSTNTTEATANGATVPTLGSPEYTRAGNFTLNQQGYLTTQSGQYVMGTSTSGAGGKPAAIFVPNGAKDVAIASDGEVTYTDPTTGNQDSAGYIQMANFNNDAGLSRDGGSLWSATTASGTTPNVATPGSTGMGSVDAGELESSNVDMATEFANMIDAQNGYEADSKVITTADQMLQTLVQMPQG